MRKGWRFLAVPLAVWLVLTCVCATVLTWVERSTRDDAAQRYHLRVNLAGDFVTAIVGDLITRQRTQAAAFLSDDFVSARDFTRTVGGFGYPAAVLLDSEGRVLQVIPPNPALGGQVITDRYPHLRSAVTDGRPAVSPVVPSASRGLPVVGFAVPFDTPSGLRVFSGAVDVSHSPVSAYLATAITLEGVKVHVVDATGAIVAANHTHPDGVTQLRNEEPLLATALAAAGEGRYLENGQWWRYTSRAIPGTPWTISSTVTEDVLFAATSGSRAAGRAALVTAAAVGLLVVAATARARRNRRELRSSEQRLRKVFDSSRIGMALSDLEGRFVRANPTLSHMLGRPEAELIGRSVVDLTHPDDVEPALRNIRDCRTGRIDGFDIDKRYLHADGHVVEAALTASLLRDEADRPQYIATQIIDMTERRALENARRADAAELARHAERLEHANEQMADFIAMLTHDVRQPLTTIVSAGELLLDDWAEMADDTRRHYLRRMTIAGHRADQLVTEILTLAQLDAGALTARPAPLDVTHAVREAVNAQAADPHQTITVTAPDEAIAFADPVHLQLLLGNLLGNAIKYGAPPVQVSVIPDQDRVVIRISDHGEGVPAAFIPHLFERFTRAETGVATTKPGTGLGLYLVSRLAQASGATIAYQPNQPRGATFLLSLPRTPIPITAAPAEPGLSHTVS
ncbi:PAS domain S-box protein [Actinoplanes sp. NEAU-A12]|uniref:Sensor-like histidine kinase SenX3 n=1 Tax=Actinoplanes sandaracinus TaxID=3045177 RepID=A0ABT6WR52_9ACTN|nr:ATP-binding protein [Actinoplanes sandaracinus]MDI6102178.1 PAS domain S-box protein [Actinoplanes sandaracinus]